MDQGSAINEQQEATPIFTAYRRGYDPEQVDRYVADQQRRLDETLHRASEAERKLAAAIGQLRELHRRVATLESEDRAAKSEAPTLDALGERVQRILQEAWEGAYSLRQNAEREVSELRESVAHEVGELRERTQREVLEERTKALTEIAEKVDAAERRATLMREETERRRQAYLERVDEDREQAVAQITYLYDQRQTALGELARLQATIEATVEEMARSPLGVPNPVSHATRKSSRHHEPIDERPVEPFATVEPARPTPEAGEMRMPGLEKPVSVYGSAEAGIPASEFATSAAAPAPPSVRPASTRPVFAGTASSVPGFPSEGPADSALYVDPPDMTRADRILDRGPAVRITGPVEKTEVAEAEAAPSQPKSQSVFDFEHE